MAGGLWLHVIPMEWQLQSPRDWRYPIFAFFKPHLYENYKVLQGGILSALMPSSVLALAQALSERSAFGGVKGVLSYSPI